MNINDITGAFIHDYNNVFGIPKVYKPLNLPVDYQALTQQALKFGDAINRYPNDGEIPKGKIVEFFEKIQSEGLSASNINQLSEEFDKITSGLNGR